jgi:hypothetical protein
MLIRYVYIIIFIKYVEETSTHLKLEQCSIFIPSNQIYRLSSDGIRDVSFGFLTYFLGPYNKHDTFPDADKWGVGNEQWDYSHLSLFEASWDFGIVSSERSHFTSYIFFAGHQSISNMCSRPFSGTLCRVVAVTCFISVRAPISALASHITVSEKHSNHSRWGLDCTAGILQMFH